MGKEFRVNAIVVITEDDLRAALLVAQASPQVSPTYPFVEPGPGPLDADEEEDEKKQKRGRKQKKVKEPKQARTKATRASKPKSEPVPEEEEDIRVKINPDDTIEDQFKSVILQAAAHKYGDAIARKIYQSWTDEDTKAVTICKGIFSEATLATVAAAVTEFPEQELSKKPRHFMSGLFQAAADSTTEPVKIPRKPACTVCEGVATHKAGCPVGARERGEEDDGGGATPARVKNATPPEPAPEPCSLGGRDGGCPIPDHAVIRQGGAHIFVHPPEVMKKLREATSTPSVASSFNAPQPPRSR